MKHANIWIFSLAVLGLGVCVYALICAKHMYGYIGTGQYWSNPWFFKAHACIFAMFAISIAMSSIKRNRG